MPPNHPQLSERIRSTRLIAFDFDGVFTDNKVYVFQDGTEAVCCFRGDGIGLEKLKRIGIQTIILSTEINPVVGFRSQKLGVACVQACHDKRATLEGVVRDAGLTFEQVAFVGNDINDLGCLEAVGLPIVVRDAHPDVVAIASYQTLAPGGHGAVREVCDLFERTLKADATAAR